MSLHWTTILPAASVEIRIPVCVCRLWGGDENERVEIICLSSGARMPIVWGSWYGANDTSCIFLRLSESLLPPPCHAGRSDFPFFFGGDNFGELVGFFFDRRDDTSLKYLRNKGARIFRRVRCCFDGLLGKDESNFKESKIFLTTEDMNKWKIRIAFRKLDVKNIRPIFYFYL